MARLLKSCGIVCAINLLFLLFVLASCDSLVAQTPPSSVTDLQFHTFHPAVAPGAASHAATSQDMRRQANGMSAFAARQINALNQEKKTRTPAQQKIDSNVLYTLRMLAGMPAAPGVDSLETGVELDANNNIAVDMVANVTDSLLNMLAGVGAHILYSNAGLRSIRALIPPSRIEDIAASPDVIFISPKQNANHSSRKVAPKGYSPNGFLAAPGFDGLASNVRKQLANAMDESGTPITWQGSVGTQGDLTHLAFQARGIYGVDGAGLKIGVLSDGVTSAALSQAMGDLPPTCGTGVASPCLTVLSGQVGSGDEGTAMLEIVHDMVPGANLYFATADNSITSFAANIEALQAAGCSIIIDDVFYFVETPFQDGQAASVTSSSQGGIVTQAVNTVASEGVFYFSAAGNQGSEDIGTSGTFEGDFVPQAAVSPLPTGNVHNFGSGVGYDTITSPGDQEVVLFWADPLGGSGNDYDLYVLDPTGASILAAATNIQNGAQDPVELVSSTNFINNDQIVVFQKTGAQNRFFHLELYRGELQVNTSGETHGHSAASGAYTVAATPAAVAFGPPTLNGPYPGPFVSTNQVEFFSSDGLRHIFFNADSSPITVGNFSSTGGTVLNKPDITAADGVSVTGVGNFDNPFYGTSAAAPAAGSVAALVLSADPAITPAEMKTALESTAIDIMAPGFDRDSGNGIVMAAPAIASLGVSGGANPELGIISANENPGNGNGVIEAGEGALLQIQLTNAIGVQAATGITATLTSTTPGVIILQPGTGTYADMAAGAGPEYSATPFQFALSPAIGCGVLVNFNLTVSYSGGLSRVLPFSLQTGMLTVTNTLGNIATVPSQVTFATGTQTGRLDRNSTVSACGTSKPFPGSIAGTHTFDSYTFTACRAVCLEPQLSAGAAGTNLLSSMYSPSYDPTNIGTNYAADAGMSSNLQSFGVDLTASTNYTLVVSDVAGNPPAPPSPPNTYTIQIPSCVFNCNPYPLPIATAQNVTVTAGPNGTANASVNNGSLDPNGNPITITQNPAGPYSVGATLVEMTVTNKVGGFAQASATVTVNPLSATITLGSLTQTYTGSALAATATTMPSGLPVTFSYSGTGGTIYGPSATAPTGVGTYKVIATVNTTDYQGSASGTLTINQAAQTISFTAPASPVNYGVAPINLTATGGESGNPVVFSLVSGPGTLSGNTLTIAGVGTVVIAANQAGNANYTAAPQVTQSVVVNVAAQTIGFSSGTLAYASGVTFGTAPLALSATSSSGLGVTFSLVSGPATLSGSTLSISGAGTVVVAANQTGNGDYAAAPQVTESIPVNKALPVVAVTDSSNAALLDNSITFTATVTSSAGTPTGAATFLDGTTPLGTAALSAGTATFSTSNLTVGTHTLTVAYGGDSNFLAATSSPVPELVQDFSFTVSSSTVTAQPGGTAAFNFTVTPSGATTLPANIALSTSGLPEGATYTFSPATLTAGEGATQVTLTVTLPQSQPTAANLRPDIRRPASPQNASHGTVSGRIASIALALILLPFAGRLRRAGRRISRTLSVFLLILAGMAAAAGISGCGSNNHGLSAQQQSYTVTITGTAGTLSHSVTVNLTVD
jgi:hypothetical protein